MIDQVVDPHEAEEWTCAGCGKPLVSQKVEAEYLGGKYPVDLPRCPCCGLVFIPEQLAVGKMSQIEKMLEDK